MPIVNVILDPVEPVYHGVKKVEVPSLAEADQQLRNWAWHIPDKMPGYHKTRFMVVWEDGSTYEGRFDLTRDHAMQHSLIGPQMRSMASWLQAHPDEKVVPPEQIADLVRHLDEEKL